MFVLASGLAVLFLDPSPPPVRAEAAAAGMAGAFALRARGVDATSANPATLDWDRKFEIQFFSAHGSFENDSYSLGDYRRWNGQHWDENDKRAILGRISGPSVEGTVGGSVSSPGVARDGWAFTMRTVASAGGEIPRDLVRLALYGNVPEETFDLNGSEGEAVSYTEFRLSRAVPAGVHWGVPVSVGANLKYIRGWDYAEVTEARGGLATTVDGIDGDAILRAVTAEGGYGLALDLGLAARAPSGWDFGLSLHNLPGWIWWDGHPEEHLERAKADSVTLGDAENESDLIETESERREIPAFGRFLPAAVSVAAGRAWGQSYVEVDLRQGFTGGLGNSTTPRLAVGLARPLRPWLEGRTGIAVGGVDGPVLAFGAGVEVWRLRSDLAVHSARSFNLFSGRGLGLGVSLAFY